MPQSDYEAVAAEYYDERHVTSRNFDACTKAALVQEPFGLGPGLVLEIGCGRGRSGEFLGAQPSRVVQLDSSPTMLDLPNREPSLLRVQADACQIPMSSGQFDHVVGFLADPFLGLDALSEARRMLRPAGTLLLTLPAPDWAACLRQHLALDTKTTRFRLVESGATVVLPSLVHEGVRLREMLALCGFEDVVITEHSLPAGIAPVSRDIEAVAEKKGVPVSEVAILQIVRARA